MRRLGAVDGSRNLAARFVTLAHNVPSPNLPPSTPPPYLIPPLPITPPFPDTPSRAHQAFRLCDGDRLPPL